MSSLNQPKTRVLFLHTRDELQLKLIVADQEDSQSEYTQLYSLLDKLGFEVNYSGKALSPKQLEGINLLVMNAPREEVDIAEINVIREFVANGGGLLLVTNAENMFHPPDSLNKIAAISGVRLEEYHNYPPTYLQVFCPHYITANLNRVRVNRVASLVANNGAYPLAYTKATRQMIMACSYVENGRIVVVGDTGIFSNGLITTESNQELAVNTFCWLAAQNVIDIIEVNIPETVEWGQTAIVSVCLRNNAGEVRPRVECALESDADAIISEPIRKIRSIPPGKTTLMRWTVRPQILGEQKLRLSIYVEGQTALFFDRLPEMNCLAPGYFTLEVKDIKGKQKTLFKTGDYFSVEGAFHCTVDLESQLYSLELELDHGLVKRSHEPGNGIDRWHVQATTSGEYKLILTLVETGQTLPVLVKVKHSLNERIVELKAAYLYPLDAEISERLKQVDESLSHNAIHAQAFEIMSPEEFIKAIYDGEAALWLLGVLAAARREQWHNPSLCDLVLTYFAPTHLAGRGSFIPYAPKLASHLAHLHPSYRKNLEYNLLASEESDEVNIKQNIAAYLLHEKYGHGFFYTQTPLGQQLYILEKHILTPETGKINKEQRETAEMLKDSAIIVNEGFATWIELTFIRKLDRDVRQAVDSREVFLIEEGAGLKARKMEGVFFKRFPPRFDSRYREGFEFLHYISQTFNLRCAIRIFLIATNIELGISETAQGVIEFSAHVEVIKERLLDPEDPGYRSHFRLRYIAELLYEHRAKLKELVRKQYCPVDCFKAGCPLESFIEAELNWRTP
jgi:hypothetical protein